MLDVIESTIKNLPSISFEEFYMEYIDQVEAYIIDKELNQVFLSVSTRKDVTHMEKSVENLLKGVEDLL